MTLKIESIEGRIRLSGEFRSEHLDQVKAEIDRARITSRFGFGGTNQRRCRRHSLSQRVRGEGNLSVALLPLHKSLDVRRAGTAGSANAKEEKGTVTMERKTHVPLTEPGRTKRLGAE